MATVGRPTIIEPNGQGSPVALFRFSFDPAYDPPTTWDVQVTEDRTFATITTWNALNQSSGFQAPRVVWATYAGTALVLGRIYYWRARGRIGATLGPWSTIVMFGPDPTAGTGPYQSWARALMSAIGYPRPTTLLGTLLPVGPEVLQLLGLEYQGRIRVRDDEHPPSTNRVAEVVGVTFHLEWSAGWEVELVTHDLQGV